jgi:hypothetical protein
MQSYKAIIEENTTLVLSTDSDLFKVLKGMSPQGATIPRSRRFTIVVIEHTDRPFTTLNWLIGRMDRGK